MRLIRYQISTSLPPTISEFIYPFCNVLKNDCPETLTKNSYEQLRVTLAANKSTGF